MFIKPRSFILVRHGAPENRGWDPDLNEQLKPLLDSSADTIKQHLAGKDVGRILLMSSELRRTRQTAAYIGERLADIYDVTEVILTPLLGLGTPLGEVADPAAIDTCRELDAFVDERIDYSTAVIGVSHEPVIGTIAYLARVEMEHGYGAVTIVR